MTHQDQQENMDQPGIGQDAGIDVQIVKDEIRGELLSAGAVAVGFASAGCVDDEVCAAYGRWIAAGRHAGMGYLERHAGLKIHPRHVLENVATVVSVAFSYAPVKLRSDALPVISCYAYGEDYHDVIRRRLSPAVDRLKSKYGGEWRICIDSAPLAERYWAMRSGIGRLGRNCSVIVDNFGSYVFLAEVLTSLPVAPDEPSGRLCCGCGACLSACPSGALTEEGEIDAGRCLNYLTIEHRGEWTGEMLEIMRSEKGRATLYGCDICQKVCPHNIGVSPTGIGEFMPKEGMLSLSAEDVAGMSQQDFSAFFKGSAIKRAKLDGLRRNALNVIDDSRSDDSPV